MLRFTLLRILQFPLILGIIYLVTFALIWVVPGDPFQKGADRTIDPLALEELKRQFRADSWQSFLGYYPLQILTRLDFGPSLFYKGWSVNEVLAASLPVSVTLGLFALTLALIVGVAVGALAAVRRGGPLDVLSLTVALVGVSVPSFVVAGVLLLLFSVVWRVFPVGGWGSWRDLILPGVALSLLPMAYIARLTRVAMIDTLSADYVRTARAKGLARGAVVWRHALRNALLPVLSYLGPAAAVTLTGSFVVEKVFNIPGLGQHFVNSVLNRDRTLILGVVMVYSVFLLAFNLLVDVA
ncbi:MAG TPA: ABC transporter permease, partial [Tepidisphaeraceae bacterium]|nr:ABC transporter permease [Tepidisphaeraceae bacterium]